MERSKAIELLKQYLEEIPRLKNLPESNEDYKLWVSKVAVVIKAGLEPEDYDTFASAHGKISIIPVTGPGGYGVPHSTYYQENITAKEIAIKKIINKYKTLGIEAEPPSGAELSELPIEIFDTLQFHPRVVEASKGLFKDKHYADAIFRAFTAVSIFVKEKTGSSFDGKQLMSSVFSEKSPIIKINDLLTPPDRDEQEGFKFLFMGGQVGIRNPKAHDNVVQTDPYRTLEYLSFASLLMKRVEEGKVVRP